MNEAKDLPRSITEVEIAVIRAALEKAADPGCLAALSAGLSQLQVVGRCSCGCDSIDFEKEEPPRSQPIANCVGTTVDGNEVGVIVWGRSDAVTGLEIFDVGPGENGKLPIPSSIRPFVSGQGA